VEVVSGEGIAECADESLDLARSTFDAQAEAFFEEDEPVDDIRAAWERGEKRVTVAPSPDREYVSRLWAGTVRKTQSTTMRRRTLRD
jgi:hypothetical protein